MLRLGSGDVPGLRRAVGAAFGLDEPALGRRPGRPGAPEPAAAPPRQGGQAAKRRHMWTFSTADPPRAPRGGFARPRGGRCGRSSSGFAGRARAPAISSTGSKRRRWRCSTRSPRATGTPRRPRRCAETVLGRADAGVERVLRFAATEVVPRIRRTPDELDHIVDALNGRHVAGRAVRRADPRAPRRAADRAQLLLRRPARAAVRALLRGRLQARRRAARAARARHRRAAADGRPRRLGDRGDAHAGRRRRGDPRAARRPADVASRVARVTGIEVVPLEELGRPRIDVTVRISGFFRDAFPHLVALLDDAVGHGRRRSTSPTSVNFVAAHARADAERLAAELGGAAPRGAARRRASSARSPARTAPACCSSSTRATGATTPTSPPSTRRGAATRTAAASTAPRPPSRCATATRGSTWP